jgi:hypothetical protein
MGSRLEIPLKVAAIVVAAYLGYVFFARYTANQRWEARQRAQTAQAAPNPAFEATYGGTAVKILQFYARDYTIAAGQETLLCYGVLNAKSVRIEPPVEDVHVALSHCVTVQPERDTRYTITAEGKDGQTASAALTLAVKRGRFPKSTRPGR